MASTQTYLGAWHPPRPAADWLHALTRHRSPVQFPLEWSGQLLVKSDKPVTATISSYKLLAACSVELYLNDIAGPDIPKDCRILDAIIHDHRTHCTRYIGVPCRDPAHFGG